MRHRKDKLKLSRPRSQRKALKNLLVRNLLLKERIKTTLAKAKVASRFADKLISLAKNDTLASRRQAYDMLQDHSLVKRLFTDIAPRFKNVPGGYTRVLKLNCRKGDGALLALAELVVRTAAEGSSEKANSGTEETKAASKKPAAKKAKAKKGLKSLFKK